ncbi:MAG: hypothetical protein ACK5MA_00140 [Parachlamydiaceae bacterium]
MTIRIFNIENIHYNTNVPHQGTNGLNPIDARVSSMKRVLDLIQPTSKKQSTGASLPTEHVHNPLRIIPIENGKFVGLEIDHEEQLIVRPQLQWSDNDRVRELIREIIEKENKDWPCSDQRITDILHEKYNVICLRRYVTDLRIRMGFPNSVERRNFAYINATSET